MDIELKVVNIANTKVSKHWFDSQLNQTVVSNM
jgi:hypothetical protein